MKYLPTLLIYLIVFIALSTFGCSKSNPQSDTGEEITNNAPSILVFTKTDGFRHASIPDGVSVIKELASENGVTVLHTEDAEYFQTDSLTEFNAVIFLSTTGDILNQQQQKAFEEFIQNGGGFVGIHSATDTEYDWPWYGEMVGAYFDSHPQVQEATISVVNNDHPATSSLPNTWTRTDEWYNFKDINPAINVLLNLEESSYNGGENGEDHPIAWYHEFEGGRVFYTGGGHTVESYSETLFREHLWGGIKYVLNQQ
jgi:type 1 glutamine amidotransferase